MSLFPRIILICLALWGAGSTAPAGMTQYTDHGKADFDTALKILNPYGTWSKVDGLWAYTPLDHQMPYTHGRWIYTEFGWCWKGDLPHSWVTEHYGYWKRGADKIWAWYPGPYWLPETVEIRATTTHIGWRSAAVDDDGNFIEQPIDRYTKTDEWTFVTLAQFAGPITPGIATKPDATRVQLEESTECRHTYLTYREIDRPGPHPADFVVYSKGGGMFPPMALRDELPAKAPAPAGKSAPVPDPAASGTNQPALLGSGADAATADTRKVKYWITMSLPTYWTPPPPDAKPEEIYMYRPDFYQDNDGIERRITLWFNPKSRPSLDELLNAATSVSRPDAGGKDGSIAPATPAVPAVPAAEAPASNPFRSPLDDSYRPGSAASTSSKNPPPPLSSGAAGPIPSPVTNTAPMNPTP